MLYDGQLRALWSLMIHPLADQCPGRRNSVIFLAQGEMNNEMLIGDNAGRRTSIHVSAQLIRIAGDTVGTHNG